MSSPNNPSPEVWLIPIKYVTTTTISPTPGQPKNETRLCETMRQSYGVVTQSPPGVSCSHIYLNTAVCSLAATLDFPANTTTATHYTTVSTTISKEYVMCDSTRILLPYKDSGPSLILSKVIVDIWVFASMSVGFTEVTRTAVPTSGQLTGDKHVLRLPTTSSNFYSATESPPRAAFGAATPFRVEKEIWSPVTSTMPCLGYSSAASGYWNLTRLPKGLRFPILFVGCLMAILIFKFPWWLGQQAERAVHDKLSQSETRAASSGWFGIKNWNRVTHPIFKEDRKKRKRRGNTTKAKRSPITLRTPDGANRKKDLVFQEDGREPLEVSVHGVTVTIECREAG